MTSNVDYLATDPFPLDAPPGVVTTGSTDGKRSVTVGDDRDLLIYRHASMQFTHRGLVVTGEPTFDVWRTGMSSCLSQHNGLQWVLGDLLNYGEQAYGEKYDQVIEDFQADYGVKGVYGTLRNWAWVAHVYPMSQRRDNLSWSHHAALAGSELHPELRKMLLDKCEPAPGHKLAALSVADLRDMVASLNRKPRWEQYDEMVGTIKDAQKHFDEFFVDLDREVRVVVYIKKDAPEIDSEVTDG